MFQGGYWSQALEYIALDGHDYRFFVKLNRSFIQCIKFFGLSPAEFKEEPTLEDI